MKNRIVLVLAALSCFVMSSGCATIIKGGSQEVSFQSEPQDATVTLSGKILGKTPLTTTIDRKSSQTLSFSKEGYKTLDMQMTTSVNPWFFGNILIGGLLGSTTDGLSGAVHEYAPSRYYITLPPENAPVDNATQGKRKIKEFVILSYSNLLKELASGEGEYLTSLLGLLDVKPDQRVTTVAKIRELSEVYKDIPSFADRVVDMYSDGQNRQVNAI